MIQFVPLIVCLHSATQAHYRNHSGEHATMPPTNSGAKVRKQAFLQTGVFNHCLHVLKQSLDCPIQFAWQELRQTNHTQAYNTPGKESLCVPILANPTFSGISTAVPVEEMRHNKTSQDTNGIHARNLFQQESSFPTNFSSRWLSGPPRPKPVNDWTLLLPDPILPAQVLMFK